MAFVGVQVSVTNAATLLCGGGGGVYDSKAAVITNQDGATSVFLGGAGVTAGTGYELKFGKTITITAISGDDLYAITSSGTVRVDVLKSRS